MSTSMMALAGFAAWTLAFIIVTIGYRGIRVLTGQLKADAWTRGRAVEDPPVVKRLNDAPTAWRCCRSLPRWSWPLQWQGSLPSPTGWP